MKLSRQELIELTRRIINCEFKSEEEADEALALLEANVPDPFVANYIFWPDPIDKDVDPVEVVDRALSCKQVKEKRAKG